MKDPPDDFVAGNISRRKFIERATAAGLTLTVLGNATENEVDAQIRKHTPAAKPGVPDWTRLQSNVQSRVVLRDSVDYENNRQTMVWNALKPERFPNAIVRVKSEADIQEAIRFARQHNLKVAIRGGGHNWQNSALRQGGLLLDLSGLNQLQVDTEYRAAVVQPGVTGAALMANLAPHGLAFPSCHSPEVRLSGFLLNGGLGWNYGAWGPSCASIEAVDLVDARGESMHANRNHNAELFWAARGAGPGFFGVVTRFYLKVFSLPKVILRSTLTYPFEEIDKVGAWLSLLKGVASHVELVCAFTRHGGQIFGTAFADTVSGAREALQPLKSEPRDLKALEKSFDKELSIEDVFGRANAAAPKGPRYAGDSGWSNASPRELLSGVRERIRSSPSKSFQVILWLPQGEVWSQRDMAFSMFASTYVHVHSIWSDAAEDAANQSWVRSTTTSLDPLKVGHYVGEADLTISPDRAKQCFSPAAWKKLNQLKRKYDPNDMFFSYLQQD